MVYTPWIASNGNAGVFSYELMELGGAVYEFSVQVYTKNSEDPDPGTPKGTASTVTSAGAYSILDATGLLELVRLKVTLTPDVEGSGGVAPCFAHFRPLNPSWQTN